jgi:hypothetical protein
MTKAQFLGLWILSLLPLETLAAPTCDILCITNNTEIHYSKNNSETSNNSFGGPDGSYRLVLQRQKMGNELSDFTMVGVFAEDGTTVDFKKGLSAHDAIQDGVNGHAGQLLIGAGDTATFQFVLNESRIVKIKCKVLSAAESDGKEDGITLLKEQPSSSTAGSYAQPALVSPPSPQ